MKSKKILSLIAATAIIFSLVGCAADSNHSNSDSSANSDSNYMNNENEILEFRPVDCGIQAQELYQYPFIGLEIELSSNMIQKMNDRDVFVYTYEDYNSNAGISYALLRFSSVPQSEKENHVMSIDIFSWEENLEKIGVIGVYEKDTVSELDSLTLCDTHKKIGESTDGVYEYYLSTNSKGNADLISEFEASKIFIDEMDELDMSLGYSAFSTNRISGLTNVGKFTTEDIFGETCTEAIFADHDITLVNVFATWCSPCVQEIPELEALRKEYESRGISLGVVAVVMDIKTNFGTDENALQQAKTLYERSEAEFPFIIPDESNMNGRLTGIESIPETFFVDRNGNIVSDPYIGARSQSEWSKIVDSELASLES